MTLVALPAPDTLAEPVPVEDALVSATDLIGLVRADRAAADAAEARILQHAVRWAGLHTVEPGETVGRAAFGEPFAVPSTDVDRPEDLEWAGLPTLRWDTAASFAAALGMSTSGGKNLIRDALTLQVRMPRVWARVLAGEVQAWRARRIAQAVQGYPDDVATLVDQLTAPRAQDVGTVVLDRLIDQAMLRLHAEERELAQLEDLDARYARLLVETINDSAICEFTARGDIADLGALDDTLTALAAVLKDHGCTESLDVRRSLALGVLADPTRAAELLHESDDTGRPDQPDSPTHPEARDRYRGDANGLGTVTRRQRMHLTLHLSEANLLGIDPVTTDHAGRAVLDQAIRTWAARDDMQVHITPIRHCGGCPRCDHAAHADDPRLRTYQPTPADRTVVAQRDPTCVFPWCTRPSGPAGNVDDDHIVAFDQAHPARGGPTCHHNLAPLCRHHHRLKTLTGWTYEAVEPGSYLWRDRYGQTFLRTPTGTTDITDITR